MEYSSGLLYYLENIWSIRSEIWLASQQTFIMVAISTIVAVVFGLTIGVCLHLTSTNQLWQNKWFNKTLGTLVDFLRAFPFVILMVAISPFSTLLTGARIGPYAASVALSIAAIPYFARLVEQSLRKSPKELLKQPKQWELLMPLLSFVF